MSIKAVGRVDEKGKLVLEFREIFTARIASMIGKNVTVEVKERKRNRSNNQNAYYWGVVVPLVAEELRGHGHDVTEDEVHEFLKARFNTVDLYNEQTGEVEKIPLSTTRLTTVEFNDYVERIVRWASEFLGLVIPLPNEQTQIDYL